MHLKLIRQDFENATERHRQRALERYAAKRAAQTVRNLDNRAIIIVFERARAAERAQSCLKCP